MLQTRLARRLTASAGWTVLAFGLSSAAALGTSVLVGRTQGAEALGRFTFVLWIVRDVAALATLGLTTAQTQLVGEAIGSGDDEVVGSYFWYCARVHGVVLLAVGPVIGLAVGWAEASWTLALTVPAGFAAMVWFHDVESVLLGQRRFRSTAIVATLMGASQLLAASIAAAFGLGWQAFIACQSVGVVAGLGAGFLLVRGAVGGRRARLSPAARTRLHGQAAVCFIGLMAASVVWGRPELLFLDRLADDAALGEYGAALRLASLTSMVPLMATQVLLPELAWLRGGGRHEEIERAYPRLVWLLLLVGAPLTIGMAGFAPVIVRALFGSELAGAAPAAAILLAGSVLASMRGVATPAILTGPRPSFGSRLAFGTIACNLALDVVLIARYGAIGAAIATTVAQAVWVLAASVHLAHHSLRVPVGDVVRIIAAAVAMAAAGALVTNALPGLGGIVVGAIVAISTYVVIATASGVARPRDLLHLGSAT